MKPELEAMVRDMMLDLANRITEVDLQDEEVKEDTIYVRKVTLEVVK